MLCRSIQVMLITSLHKAHISRVKKGLLWLVSTERYGSVRYDLGWHTLIQLAFPLPTVPLLDSGVVYAENEPLYLSFTFLF